MLLGERTFILGGNSLPERLLLQRNLATAQADAGFGIVDASELTGSNALDGLGRMNGPLAFGILADETRHEVIDVAHLELDGLFVGRLFPRIGGNEVQVGQAEVVPVLQLRVPAVSHEDDVLADILLHYEPWSAAQSQALALSDGVEPITSVMADYTSCLDVDDLALLFAQQSAHELVVVNLPQETDALTVLSVCTGKTGFLCQSAHFVLHEVTDRKYGMPKLLVCELGQEVGLVLDGIGCRTEPYESVALNASGIMTCGDIVVMTANLLFERAKLDEAVAHHIGIGCQAKLDSLDCIAHDLFPIFLLEVGHL